MACHVNKNENSPIRNQIDSIKLTDSRNHCNLANWTSNQGRLNCFRANIRPHIYGVHVERIQLSNTFTRSPTHPNINYFLILSAKHAIFQSNVKQWKHIEKKVYVLTISSLIFLCSCATKLCSSSRREFKLATSASFLKWNHVVICMFMSHL